MSQPLSSPEHVCHADETWQVYSPIDRGRTSLTPELHHPPHSHLELRELEAHLLVQAPQLRLIEFRLEACTPSNTIANLLPPNTNDAQFDHDLRDCFSDIADYVAAVTLSQTFPRSYIFKVPSSKECPTVLFLSNSSQHLLRTVRPERMTVHCAMDADTISDMHTIFLDRGHCEIPMQVQFTHQGDWTATAEPILCVHPTPPLLKPS